MRDALDRDVKTPILTDNDYDHLHVHVHSLSKTAREKAERETPCSATKLEVATLTSETS